MVEPTQTKELGDVGTGELGVEQEEMEATFSSQPGEGILKNNPKSRVKVYDLYTLRYY